MFLISLNLEHLSVDKFTLAERGPLLHFSAAILNPLKIAYAIGQSNYGNRLSRDNFLYVREISFNREL